MSRTALQTKNAAAADVRASDDMEQQLKAMSSSRLRDGGAMITDLKILTFDNDFETAAPDPIVMWEKSTCC